MYKYWLSSLAKFSEFFCVYQTWKINPKYFFLFFVHRASTRNLYEQQARLKYQLWQPMHEVDAFEPRPIDET